MGVLGRLFRRRRLEAQLDAELRDHFERQTADYVRAGLGEGEARRRARIELGGLEQVKEECRDARGTRLLEDLGQDLSYGVRVLRRSPTFTMVAILSLALGIGANTAIYTLVDSLILRALPVRDPLRLVRLEGGSWTNPIWEQIRDRQREVLESAAAFSDTHFDLAKGGEAQVVPGFFASGSFFDVIGVPAILGRTFTLEDDRRGGGPDGPVAVISYAFWQRRYGGAADAVGRTLALNTVPLTIVGVTPPSFFGPTVGSSFDVAVPIGLVDRIQPNDRSWLDARSTWWLEILGRLKPGQDVKAATLILRHIQPQIREATLPQHWRPQDLERYLRESPLTLVPAATGFSDFRGQYARPLVAVMAVVVLVLLIACANLASLQLARANARRQELSARLALGASRSRLLRQLLTESLLLAVPGGLLGLVFAQWGSRLLVGQITSQGGPMPGSPLALDVSLHWRVLVFTLGVTLATAVLFGVAPALRAGRLSPYDAIKQQGRSGAGDGPHVLGGLVMAQVALSLVLVFAAGLFLRTFSGLASRDLGLTSDGILLVNLDAQRSAVPPERRAALYADAQEAVAAVPGVAGAAVSVVNPVSGMGWNGRVEVQGATPLSEEKSISWMNAVTPGWFGTYGTPVLAGRDFDRHDRPGAPHVAIVNEAFARRFLGGQSPVGRLLQCEGPPTHQPPPVEVVGLVKDTVYRSPRDPMEPIVYLPVSQLTAEEAWPFVTLGVRAAAGSPALLTRNIAAAVSRVDPDLSITFRLFSDQVGASVMRERLVAWLSGFFGGLALLLAGIGLYGVTSYAVSRQRTEIAVRMALGAEARGVVRLVLGRALRLAGLGLLIGVAASLWLARFVTSLLFGLEPRDLPTLLAAAAVLAGICVLAAGLPARRASLIDPAEVLREG
jgi:putative ABC transport system permease protein